MKTYRLALFARIASALMLCASGGAQTATTIDVVNRCAYGANIGWMDWYADGANGAVLGDYACSGYIYSANVGWINLGSGSPANGIYYQNLSSNDFGVNNDGLGNLRGYAYGANIGWINFESTGAPAVNLRNGQLSGCVWSANCGWISLSNSYAYAQTDTLYPGPLGTNDLPIAWLLTYFGTTAVNPKADPNGTGMTVGQDYIAGTNPNDPNSKLVITSQSVSPDGASICATITWSSQPTRLYYLQQSLSLNAPEWVDCGLGLISPDGSSTTRSFTGTNGPASFYRVEAVLPLAP